jgi:hypothetical protein
MWSAIKVSLIDVWNVEQSGGVEGIASQCLGLALCHDGRPTAITTVANPTL